MRGAGGGSLSPAFMALLHPAPPPAPLYFLGIRMAGGEGGGGGDGKERGGDLSRYSPYLLRSTHAHRRTGQPFLPPPLS